MRHSRRLDDETVLVAAASGISALDAFGPLSRLDAGDLDDPDRRWPLAARYLVRLEVSTLPAVHALAAERLAHLVAARRPAVVVVDFVTEPVGPLATLPGLGVEQLRATPAIGVVIGPSGPTPSLRYAGPLGTVVVDPELAARHPDVAAAGIASHRCFDGAHCPLDADLVRPVHSAAHLARLLVGHEGRWLVEALARPM